MDYDTAISKNEEELPHAIIGSDDTFTFGYDLDAIQNVLNHLKSNGYVEGRDYEQHIGYGDDMPNAITLKNPKTNYGLEYRLSMNNVVELISWTPCNSAVIDGCAKSFLDLDTSWLLTNQNYQITFRINELGTKRIIAEKLSFKIVDKLYPQDY